MQLTELFTHKEGESRTNNYREPSPARSSDWRYGPYLFSHVLGRAHVYVNESEEHERQTR